MTTSDNDHRVCQYHRIGTAHGLPGEQQDCSSVASPVHSAPPFSAGTLIVLVLPWVPHPLVTEQLPHTVHWDHVQATAKVFRVKFNEWSMDYRSIKLFSQSLWNKYKTGN